MDEKITRSCQYCRKDISQRRVDAQHCGAIECRKNRARQAYHSRLNSKTCLRCGCDFLGTDKATHCGCAYKKCYKQYKQEIRCCSCDVLIDTRLVKHTNSPALVTRTKLCPICRSSALARMADSKRGQLNPNWKGGPKPRSSKAECAKNTSMRMQKYNPMFIAEVRNKVSKSLKGKDWQNWPRGREHWLWKGNRPVMMVLRTLLAPWRQQVMLRDGFRCTMCCSRHNLEVHHLRPFDNIVTACAKKLGILIVADVDMKSDEFCQLSYLVILEHAVEIGQTLCRDCHALADTRRHIKTVTTQAI